MENNKLFHRRTLKRYINNWINAKLQNFDKLHIETYCLNMI